MTKYCRCGWPFSAHYRIKDRLKKDPESKILKKELRLVYTPMGEIFCRACSRYGKMVEKQSSIKRRLQNLN